MSEKVCQEVAEQEFERFCQTMRIDTSVNESDAEESKDFTTLKNKLVKAIQSGDLVIGDDGKPTYTTVFDEEPLQLTINRPKGRVLMEAAKITNSGNTIFHAMAQMCSGYKDGKQVEVNTKTFALMDAYDVKFCLSLATLFLA